MNSATNSQNDFRFDVDDYQKQLARLRARRDELDASVEQRERETKKIGPYFAQRVKQRQAELETTAAASKERNRKLLAKVRLSEQLAYLAKWTGGLSLLFQLAILLSQSVCPLDVLNQSDAGQIDNIIDHTKEVDGDAARRKAAAQVDASRESYLSTIRRLYPHWKHKVELMTKAQAAAYENAVKASEHRRKQAAKAYEQELEDRSRLMHGHHAALQAHEQEGMEEYLRQESRIQLSSQEQAVSAARPSNAPVYYPPKLPSEPTPGAPPEPQTLATLLTSAGPIPYEPPPYPHLPPQQVPFPVANTFQHPGLVNAYGAPGRPGQPPQPQPPGYDAQLAAMFASLMQQQQQQQQQQMMMNPAAAAQLQAAMAAGQMPAWLPVPGSYPQPHGQHPGQPAATPPGQLAHQVPASIPPSQVMPGVAAAMAAAQMAHPGQAPQTRASAPAAPVSGAAQAGPPVSRGLTEKDLQEALAAQ
ncbi:hypothetical protein CYMTET_33072, partial [Cymbomonas tetramitiformis]